MKRGGRWVRREQPRDYLLTADHFTLAREFGVDHGEAVTLARTFCASGYGAGAHGSLCPCNSCTTRAVIILNAKAKAWVAGTDSLREQLLAIHKPETVEIEVFTTDEYGTNRIHGREFPDCIEIEDCPGHTLTIQSCVECGESVDCDGSARYSEWPCRTAEALSAAEPGAGQASPNSADDNDTGHRRYDSDEFDYSGCEKCDANGDTVGWPCPTISERIEEARALTQVPAHVTWTPIHEAVAHAVCCGPDGQDWLEARVFAVQVLEALRDEGHDVVPIVPAPTCTDPTCPACRSWPEGAVDDA